LDNTQQLLSEFIANEFLGDQPKSLSGEENLIEAGVVDSLAILMLINYIEGQFSVTIEPEDVVMENFESVAAITRLINMRNVK
jgi:acyl carrier protein